MTWDLLLGTSRANWMDLVCSRSFLTHIGWTDEGIDRDLCLLESV